MVEVVCKVGKYLTDYFWDKVEEVNVEVLFQGYMVVAFAELFLNRVVLPCLDGVKRLVELVFLFIFMKVNALLRSTLVFSSKLFLQPHLCVEITLLSLVGEVLNEARQGWYVLLYLAEPVVLLSFRPFLNFQEEIKVLIHHGRHILRLTHSIELLVHLVHFLVEGLHLLGLLNLAQLWLYPPQLFQRQIFTIQLVQ